MPRRSINKTANYRKVKSCPNCQFVFDRGIDEEVLICGKTHEYVEHDGICDEYQPEYQSGINLTR